MWDSSPGLMTPRVGHTVLWKNPERFLKLQGTPVASFCPQVCPQTSLSSWRPRSTLRALLSA